MSRMYDAGPDVDDEQGGKMSTSTNETARRNVVVIMNDTLRRDHVAAYGDPAPWARPGREGSPFITTPSLDRLAAESAMFDRFYVSSYPTIPCRTDLFTGRFGFPVRGWQPLEPEDVVLAEILSAKGWTTQLIFDTPMLSQESYNFDRGFTGWDFVRGQHGDRWATSPCKAELPGPARKLRSVGGTRQYLRNIAQRRCEDDWMCAQTTGRAMRWLEDNRNLEGFCLWVDMWDPHDPFDAPEFDLERYICSEHRDAGIVFPQYGRSDYLTEKEINFVRGSYAALVTLMDRWVGKLLDKIDVLGLSKNTMIVYLTDHGHLFGDHGLEGKPTAQLGNLYEPTIRCPLLIRHPAGLGRASRPGGMTQHTDILPTILDFLGVEIPSSVQGTSLLPALRDPSWAGRELVVSGRHSPYPNVATTRRDADGFDGWAGPHDSIEPLTVTSREWSLIYPPGGERPPELYNLVEDPGQHNDLGRSGGPRVAELRDAMLAFLLDNGAPVARVDVYRESKASPTRKRSYPYLEPDAVLFVIVDPEGRRFAYDTEAGATERLDATMPEQAPQPMTFGELVRLDPHAMVDLGQYCWASDLVAGAS